MKVIVTEPEEQEVDCKIVSMSLPVHHEEDFPEGFPGRKGNRLWIDIEVDSGQVAKWPQGKGFDLHMKVTDGGTYRLLDKDGVEITAIVQDYVPHGLVPGSYGDYVELTIDQTGLVTNWPENPDLSEFFERY